MTERAKSTAVQEGVREAWDFWLSQHPVSVPDIIQEAIKQAVTTWFDAHTDELLETLAATIAQQSPSAMAAITNLIERQLHQAKPNE
jgi:hypothetical protein